MKSSSEHDEQDRKIIKLLEDLGTFDAEYPSDLFTARRAALLAQLKGSSPVENAGELPAGEEETVKLLESLKAVQTPYPAELLAARRAAFIAQVDRLSPAETGDELPAGDREIVRLLGHLKSAPVNYPPALLAARRSAFLRQAAGAGRPGVWDQLRGAIQRIFPYATTPPAAPATGFTRLSLVIAIFLLVVLIGSLLFSPIEPSLSPSPSQTAAPTPMHPAASGEIALTICQPEDPALSCPSGELTPDQNLADSGNGAARPAVSKDARTSDSGVHRASYVNDGWGGAGWVSDSPYSWIKIDLGRVTTINTVSLQKGSPGPDNDHRLGQFVIAVAVSDVYSDGNSSNDFVEYAQVFSSTEAGFSGTVSPASTIRTSFPSTQARYVKITFAQAGAAIEQIGVFLAPPAAPAARETSAAPDDLPTITFTSSPTTTPGLTGLATSVSTGMPQSTNTAALLATDILLPAASGTPASTEPPANTSTPVLTDPLPSATPTPLPTLVPPTAIPSTAVPPTAIPPTVQPPPVSSDPIVVMGNDQMLTFTCNGNPAFVRGHANIVTLLGACSSITVTGNGNLVFYEAGAPAIADQGRDNVIARR